MYILAERKKEKDKLEFEKRVEKLRILINKGKTGS